MPNNCPYCGTTNRDTARFCQNCARSLGQDVTCPTCGAVNPPNARFCHQCAATLAAAAPTAGSATGMLSENTLLNNRYLIVQKVGQGGMGAVYKAADTRLGQKVVAVKELSEAALTSLLEKQQAQQAFEQEAQMLAALSHPNLPRVTDHFSQGGKQYLVMDFVDGRTLEELLDATKGPVDVNQVVDWAGQLCDVLGYLHGQQPPIIFRDLKPGNIMLDRDGRIKLIDFGIARHFKAGKATDTTSFGTAGYAPPEQYGKGQTDARSDVYALGATLHHLLTRLDPGDSPFTFVPVRQKNSCVPESVERAIMVAVAQDPAQRWQSAAQMKQALTAPAQQMSSPPPVVATTAAAPVAPSPYIASATPAAVAPPLKPAVTAASVFLPRAGYLAWLALAVGVYAVYRMLLPFVSTLSLVSTLQSPISIQLIYATLAAIPALLLYKLSRRPGSALLMGLIFLAGIALSSDAIPPVVTLSTPLAAAMAVELVFAFGGFRKFGFWIVILAAAAGAVVGWIAPRLLYGGSLTIASVDEPALVQLAGALLGGVVAYVLAALLTPSWWRSARAIPGRFNYIQVLFIALASIAFVGLFQVPLVRLISGPASEPRLQNLVLAAFGGVAMPLAFVIARRPGTAVIASGIQLALLLVAGAAWNPSGSMVLQYLAGALAFEFVFFTGLYRRYGFWRLIIASVLAAVASREALNLIYGRPLDFEMSLIYYLAGAALGGGAAYLIGRIVRR